MKKSLIALAVAGAMTAPVVAQADATLYGNVEVEGVFGDNQDADIQIDDARIGVKGSDATYIDGVSSFYNIELEYNPSGTFGETDPASVRKANVGLTGGFGTVIAGRFTNPVDATEANDLYSESVSTDYFMRNPDRITAAAYITPTFGGFSAYAGIAAQGDSGKNFTENDNEDVDGYLVGANYSIGGFNADLGYWNFDGSGDVAGPNAANDAEYIGLALSYAVASFTFTGTYAEADSVGAGLIATNAAVNTDLWTLAADYALENTNFGISYMEYDEEAKGSSDVNADEWGVYVSHALSNKASIKAQYTSADTDDALEVEDVFVVGYNVSF
ncbi:porin [Marinobacterium sp. YM272]|uniref:porin n=1 Tax=Marinobacterium sp. YM272 TaxID=3421654 RepID=UPI003D7F6619